MKASIRITYGNTCFLVYVGIGSDGRPFCDAEEGHESLNIKFDWCLVNDDCCSDVENLPENTFKVIITITEP